MLSTREASNALFGAYRLARYDAGGLLYFNTTITGFWRSFYAAVIIAPPYVLLILLQYSANVEPTPFFGFLAVKTVSYIAGWFAYPLLMFYVSQSMRREHLYMRYIIAYNWAAVLQNGVILPIFILATAGILPNDAAAFLSLIAFIAILTYSWFIAYKGLNIPGLSASGVVVAEFSLAFILQHWSNSLLIAPVSG
jgi:hypothetical protein